ncbi:hypothetical protein Dxin01_02448 [Deinococcus xinjiangensis]|uniref:HTH cro/C1-type domain-containing protein n=1 Tax=Deinococcus xinjiangensis TaxID=457454 RepID=A0ABP9VBT8_9DEIO
MPRPRRSSPPSTAARERLWFGENLRRERVRQGLTLEDLAERSGITWSYISHLERGMRNVGIDNMSSLAAAVGKPLMELLAEPDPDDPSAE